MLIDTTPYLATKSVQLVLIFPVSSKKVSGRDFLVGLTGFVTGLSVKFLNLPVSKEF